MTDDYLLERVTPKEAILTIDRKAGQTDWYVCIGYWDVEKAQSVGSRFRPSRRNGITTLNWSRAHVSKTDYTREAFKYIPRVALAATFEGGRVDDGNCEKSEGGKIRDELHL